MNGYRKPSDAACARPKRRMNAGTCIHCRTGTGSRTRRMLCWKCWSDAEIKAQYPGPGRSRKGIYR